MSRQFKKNREIYSWLKPFDRDKRLELLDFEPQMEAEGFSQSSAIKSYYQIFSNTSVTLKRISKEEILEHTSFRRSNSVNEESDKVLITTVNNEKDSETETSKISGSVDLSLLNEEEKLAQVHEQEHLANIANKVINPVRIGVVGSTNLEEGNGTNKSVQINNNIYLKTADVRGCCETASNKQGEEDNIYINKIKSTKKIKSSKYQPSSVLEVNKMVEEPKGKQNELIVDKNLNHTTQEKNNHKPKNYNVEANRKIKRKYSIESNTETLKNPIDSRNSDNNKKRRESEPNYKTSKASSQKVKKSIDSRVGDNKKRQRESEPNCKKSEESSLVSEVENPIDSRDSDNNKKRRQSEPNYKKSEVSSSVKVSEVKNPICSRVSDDNKKQQESEPNYKKLEVSSLVTVSEVKNPICSKDSDNNKKQQESEPTYKNSDVSSLVKVSEVKNSISCKVSDNNKKRRQSEPKYKKSEVTSLVKVSEDKNPISSRDSDSKKQRESEPNYKKSEVRSLVTVSEVKNSISCKVSDNNKKRRPSEPNYKKSEVCSLVKVSEVKNPVDPGDSDNNKKQQESEPNCISSEVGSLVSVSEIENPIGIRDSDNNKKQQESEPNYKISEVSSLVKVSEVENPICSRVSDDNKKQQESEPNYIKSKFSGLDKVSQVKNPIDSRNSDKNKKQQESEPKCKSSEVSSLVKVSEVENPIGSRDNDNNKKQQQSEPNYKISEVSGFDSVSEVENPIDPRDSDNNKKRRESEPNYKTTEVSNSVTVSKVKDQIGFKDSDISIEKVVLQQESNLSSSNSSMSNLRNNKKSFDIRSVESQITISKSNSNTAEPVIDSAYSRNTKTDNLAHSGGDISRENSHNVALSTVNPSVLNILASSNANKSREQMHQSMPNVQTSCISVGTLTPQNILESVTSLSTGSSHLQNTNINQSSSLDRQNILMSLEPKSVFSKAANIYTFYFGESFEGIPEEIVSNIRDFLQPKGIIMNISTSFIVNLYLFIYTNKFNEVINAKVNKTAEILHLAIADWSRKKQHIISAQCLASEGQRQKETKRANDDYQKMLTIRGPMFQELFSLILESCGDCEYVMLTALYFRIIHALMIIDTGNVEYIYTLREPIVALMKVTVSDFSKAFNYLFNMSESTFLVVYTFVKQCVVSLHAAGYKEGGLNDILRLARLPPCGLKMKNLLLKLEEEYKAKRSLEKDTVQERNVSGQPSVHKVTIGDNMTLQVPACSAFPNVDVSKTVSKQQNSLYVNINQPNLPAMTEITNPNQAYKTRSNNLPDLVVDVQKTKHQSSNQDPSIRSPVGQPSVNSHLDNRFQQIYLLQQHPSQNRPPPPSYHQTLNTNAVQQQQYQQVPMIVQYPMQQRGVTTNQQMVPQRMTRDPRLAVRPLHEMMPPQPSATNSNVRCGPQQMLASRSFTRPTALPVSNPGIVASVNSSSMPQSTAGRQQMLASRSFTRPTAWPVSNPGIVASVNSSSMPQSTAGRQQMLASRSFTRPTALPVSNPGIVASVNSSSMPQSTAGRQQMLASRSFTRPTALPVSNPGIVASVNSSSMPQSTAGQQQMRDSRSSMRPATLPVSNPGIFARVNSSSMSQSTAGQQQILASRSSVDRMPSQSYSNVRHAPVPPLLPVSNQGMGAARVNSSLEPLSTTGQQQMASISLIDQLQLSFLSNMPCSAPNCSQLSTLVCSLCWKTFYCTRSCQILHWENEHSRICTNQYGQPT